MHPPHVATSRLLVTAQFTILGYFFFFHPFRQPLGPQDMVAGTLVLSGIALGVWAFLTMRRLSHFRVSPEPAAGGTLVTEGPYAFIRHPMYSALLLVTFGLFLNYPLLSHFLAFALLFAILQIKLHLEETWLAQTFPRYPEYQASTKKLFPFLY